MTGDRAYRWRGVSALPRSLLPDTAAVADSASCDHRHVDMIRDSRDEREQPDSLPLSRRMVERSPMPASFVTLSNDRIRAGIRGQLRFGQSRRGREPRDALRLRARDERLREHSHD